MAGMVCKTPASVMTALAPCFMRVNKIPSGTATTIPKRRAAAEM